MANARARGSATMPTTTPALTSRVSDSRVYPSRRQTIDFGTNTRWILSGQAGRLTPPFVLSPPRSPLPLPPTLLSRQLAIFAFRFLHVVDKYSSRCLNMTMTEPKAVLYEQLARMAKALSAPARVEILDV